jgi:AraC family transcriptional regulator of adaptative response/methylated-DNA-[protein]-cysteine methyltransferase
LIQEWPSATIKEDKQLTSNMMNRVFSHPVENKQPLSVLVKGTNFQVNVWQALLSIPTGELVSYSDIAHAINNQKAVRAVGRAVGANPVAFLIPCHRVIRQNGDLGGYRWGLTRKHAMLMRESAERIDTKSKR